jgi:hypothetical protein
VNVTPGIERQVLSQSMRFLRNLAEKKYGRLKNSYVFPDSLLLQATDLSLNL